MGRSGIYGLTPNPGSAKSVIAKAVAATFKYIQKDMKGYGQSPFRSNES
jgi:hypothetical protein